MKRVLISWSSGKDCAWSLHLLRQQPDIEVVGLLTTINAEFDRVAMHGTRRSILEAQAESVGLPLWQIPLPWPCSNEIYEQRMSQACGRAISEGITSIAFGDLFLQDIRSYHEVRLKPTGLEPLFPLWGIPTGELAQQMIAGGLHARVVCVDSRQLDSAFAGRDFDAEFLADLPSSVDPCGENGEFHTCVYDGPIFSYPIPLESGDTISRNGFIYTDLAMIGPALRSN